MRRFFSLLACLAVLVAGPAADHAAIDEVFKAFWDAGDPVGAAKRIGDVLKTGVTFDDALARVRRGRDYSPDAPRGAQRFVQRVTTLDHPYTVIIPDNYDSTRAYQMRVQLHGGANRLAPPDFTRAAIDRLPSAVEEIKVFPAAWQQSIWWQFSQVENLSRILDRIKRRYNVDENRVYLTGTSDGGTGVYFMALRDTTSWASFLPLIGSMTVLANSAVGVDGEMYPGNAANKPFFIVNAGRDHLYPAHLIQPYVEHLVKLGGEVTFRVKPESEHSTDWWPEERGAFEVFVTDHPRDPLPDKLSWETERADRYNRAHWLVIDRLGDVSGQSDLADSNLLHRGREYDFGLRINANIERGRRVIDIAPNSNAQRVGLRTGDLFVDIDGRSVETSRDIFAVMMRWEMGTSVRMTVERGGRRMALEGEFRPDEVDVPPLQIFPRKRPSGRVDLARHGNVVEARTHGVRAFTLLLSPSKFDFNRPVKIVANGRTVFEERVEPKVETLLKWAARDNDRMMVFGAEVHVDLNK
ncbi:MAG: PDZ domain-containing protein [Vicinamibacterales bacterium]|nr:PDZ domain-containing protein [Vicinamibacterales bacterium]